ncbi:MAG: hypothetical protein AB7G06_09095 [Bdellovibrionales bacterium]
MSDIYADGIEERDLSASTARCYVLNTEGRHIRFIPIERAQLVKLARSAGTASIAALMLAAAVSATMPSVNRAQTVGLPNADVTSTLQPGSGQ